MAVCVRPLTNVNGVVGHAGVLTMVPHPTQLPSQIHHAGTGVSFRAKCPKVNVWNLESAVQEQLTRRRITESCRYHPPPGTKEWPQLPPKLGPLRCEDRMKLTHKFAEMTPEKRPQDPHMDGTGLRFQTMEHGGFPTQCPKPSN